ncbi:Uncharacterised protein [Raoultella terrigena]|uniref:Uncharacterized protein n=1 Tax=Raoultella terrigena TaxID=577 RepID=A0A3P8KB39_RAOTE|nr:Uncharacterised protein [Raoultella terrigena]
MFDRVALLRDGLHQIWLTMQRGLSWTRDTAQRMSRHSSSTVVSMLSAFLSPLALGIHAAITLVERGGRH